jgi:class 3 adenylate cyclase
VSELGRPETRYAKSGDVHIAYQVLGDGPLDLVFVPGIASHLDLQWEEPLQASFFRRLASFSRLIRFDKRGEGLSDRVSPMPALDERMDDVRAVMDAAGSRRAALLGLSEGGPMCIVFAATHPERIDTLILLNSFARLTSTIGYPWGVDPGLVDASLDATEQLWGTGALVELFVPEADEAFGTWWGGFERSSVSPGAMVEALRIGYEIDVRPVLPVVGTRTLVMNSRNDRLVDVESGKYLAERIGGATYVEIPSSNHFPWPDWRTVTGEIEHFLTGARRAAELDRVLSTVLFTDIVESTARAAAVGDQRWHELLEQHHVLVRDELRRFRGREVKATGDGFLAMFDGPARAVRCALEIRNRMGKLGLEIRAGLHTGECELTDGDIVGIAVHICARIAGLASAGDVFVSSTVKDLVTGSGLEFSGGGTYALKGVPDPWHLYQVLG